MQFPGRQVWLGALLSLWATLPVAADTRLTVAAIVEAVAVPAGTVMVVDGQMNEAVWEQAPKISDFLQREPAEGVAPSFATEARIAYDAEAIYVAVRAEDPEPERLVGLLTRRDQASPSDWLKVVIDSYFDHRSAFEFAVNPAGVRRDRYYFNDGASDDSWDAVWDVEVSRDSGGWRAEFRIPFSQLRFNNTTGGPVGFALIREVGRLAETSTWPLLARSANGFVSQFAEVRGLQMSGTPRRFEILPYALGQIDTQATAAGNPLLRGTELGGAVGLDLKYAVRPGLTLTTTLNPDFGQVEADPAVVNLDAFEAFFPERRPFFVEGSGTFRFNMDCNDGACTGLFYSRRIGRTPQGSADTADGEFERTPPTTTMIGAAKLTGRAGGFSIGALTALTATEEAQLTTLGSVNRRVQTVEPMTGYTVVRARREFQNQSSLGFMTTNTNRRLTDDVRFLPGAATTGGIDYDWRPTRNYSLQGFVAGSDVRGDAAAIERLQTSTVHAFQRPDADHVQVNAAATTLRGHAGSVSFNKIGGERTRFSTFLGYKSPGFDSNDLGFQRRADEKTMSNWFQWRDQVPGRFVRNYNLNVNQWADWNFGGDRTHAGGNVNMHWVWQNNYQSGFGVSYNAAPFRDRVTRGGPGVLGNRSMYTWFYTDLDQRQPVQPGYNGSFETDGKGTTRHGINPRVTWRPSSAVSVQSGFRYNINHDDAQWVENVEADGATHHVFGRLDQRTVALTLRLNYTLTPMLSFQSYAEPFVSVGEYQSYKALADGRAARYPDRYRPYPYEGDANFTQRSFRTTNVLRWEFRPGSALFLVWQQGRQERLEQARFDFARDFSGVFSAPTLNVLLLKFSYWINR